MRNAVLLSICILFSGGAASAQVHTPGLPYFGDPLAARHQYRMETLRLQSEQQAAFARQQQLNARLTEMEIRSRRQPEPYVPLVDVSPSPDAQRRAREAATARRGAVAAGVTQIDDWLARTPR